MIVLESLLRWTWGWCFFRCQVSVFGELAGERSRGMVGLRCQFCGELAVSALIFCVMELIVGC